MGHIKTINFPFETKGKLMVLGVPILKHFRVVCAVSEVIMTRHFLTSKVDQIWSHTITQTIRKTLRFTFTWTNCLKLCKTWSHLWHPCLWLSCAHVSKHCPEICCFGNLDHMVVLITLNQLSIWTVVKCCTYPKIWKHGFTMMQKYVQKMQMPSTHSVSEILK